MYTVHCTVLAAQYSTVVYPNRYLERARKRRQASRHIGCTEMVLEYPDTYRSAGDWDHSGAGKAATLGLSCRGRAPTRKGLGAPESFSEV